MRSITPLLALIVSLPLAAGAQVDVHITVGPPIPGVVFEQPPPLVPVPQSDVYYAPSVGNYDTYRMGEWWYINRDGYWYRSHDHRSFEPIEYDRIPPPLLSLPGEYRRYPSYHEQRRREQAYDKGYTDAVEGAPPRERHRNAGRARAYHEGEYDGSHEGPGEKHQGKHYGKHEGKHTQHDY